MITRKNNRTYTEAEVNGFLSSLSTANTDDSWRTLGYINASAFKGYGRLSDEAAAYNWMIYQAKDKAIRTLVPMTKDVRFFGSVLYVRLSDGIQVSFHVNTLGSNNGMHDLMMSVFDKSVEWDGVKESYEYTDINAYREACAAYQKAEAERIAREQQEMATVRASFVKVLRNANTRRSFGVEMSREEVEQVNAFPYGYTSDLVFVAQQYISNYGKAEMLAWKVRTLLTSK